METKTGDIYDRINKVMSGIEGITKDKTSQGYKFRGIDDVYKAVNPVLVEHGVFCMPEVLTTVRETHTARSGGALYFTFLTVRYTFYCLDGSSVSAVVTGEGMDSSDKGANKAMSSAFKMAFFQVFCIPTEKGSSDSEEDSHEVATLLTFSELEAKIKESKAVKHLGNIWKKYQLDILALSEEDQNRITVVKDRRKDELSQEGK